MTTTDGRVMTSETSEFPEPSEVPDMSEAVDDPVRAEVERRLRALVDASLAAPRALTRAVDACVRRRVDSAREIVGRPFRLAQSLVEVVAGSGQPPEQPAPAHRRIVDTDVIEEPAPDAPVVSRGAAADLPIEEYESLAASQVVARVERLSASDLRRVRRFEAANRGRRTVLGKIDQLLG